MDAAYALLRDQWRAGERDRELALHLMWLAWHLQTEPPYLTGADEIVAPSGELPGIFEDTHAWLLPDGAASTDAEALYTTGLAAWMFPWALGNEHFWSRRAAAYRARYRALVPGGIEPAIFDDRGAYGHYYRGHAESARAKTIEDRYQF